MAGRKPKYTPERIARICKAIENGETNETAAKIGGVSVSTFCEWQATKREFSEAIKRAKEKFEDWQMNGILADAKKSLKTLICGQEYEETKTEYENDSENPGTPKIKKQTIITRKVMPNPAAVIFALCNRDPENWKNRQTNEITGSLKTESETKVDLSNVPDSLLEQLAGYLDGQEN